jgi:hypothetical protein
LFVALMASMEYVASLDVCPMQVANSVKFDDDETTEAKERMFSSTGIAQRLATQLS